MKFWQKSWHEAHFSFSHFVHVCCDFPTLFTFPPIPSLGATTVAYSVCVCFLAGSKVRLCTVGTFHCVAICPDTYCCTENKCKSVLSHPRWLFCCLCKEQLSFTCFYFCNTFHICAVCVYPHVQIHLLQQVWSIDRVCLHSWVYPWT